MHTDFLTVVFTLIDICHWYCRYINIKCSAKPPTPVQKNWLSQFCKFLCIVYTNFIQYKLIMHNFILLRYILCHCHINYATLLMLNLLVYTHAHTNGRLISKLL